MTLTLLDTGVVSRLIDPRADARSAQLSAFTEATALSQGLVIAFVTQYELRRGIEVLVSRGEGRRKRVALERFLGAAFVLGLDERGGEGWNVAARLWAEAKVQKPSLVLSEGDLLIAATALFHERALATTDERLAHNLGKLSFPMPVHLLR